MTTRDLVIGVDVGGTFTDAVVLDRETGTLLDAFKVPSTPADPAEAVLCVIARIARAFDVRGSVVCHGTTVGTNTLIERLGARSALLATEGFSDVVALRRQDRPSLYDFDVRISEPLVPAARRIGVAERTAADGSIVRPLVLEDHTAALARLQAAGVQSVAISFLHAYANADHEQQMEAAVRDALPGVYVTRSSDVCPEFREYERTSTTVVNAYIGPAVGRYVGVLSDALRAQGVGRLMIVKSNGGLTSPENAARYPVHLIESGPAAQLTASASFARAKRCPDMVAFDMGGTTAKAGVIRAGEPEMTTEFYADRLVDGREVGGYAIRSSVLDLVEIGAGGGSIAWIDEARVLKVGPTSAGASPGPACYGRGGTRPTVTDAHAVIGTLSAELFEASGIAFHREAAVAAIRQHVAEPFGWPIARAAYAIIDIAVANMAEMVRLTTTRRGLDPRDFALLASGGAGPLHAAAVGEEIGSAEVIVPPYPGMFSALGATLGNVRHEVTTTLLRHLDEIDDTALASAFDQLATRADVLMAAEPEGITRPPPLRVLEARFSGQLFELPVPLGPVNAPLPAIGEISRHFRDIYRAEYGFDLPDARVQAVNARLIATGDMGHSGDLLFADPEAVACGAQPARHIDMLTRTGETCRVPVYRAADAHGATLAGPLVIEHSGATVWVHEGQTARIGAHGQVNIALSGGRR
ncbi:hydantoinase/oxoprolinase family protein [Xanthobacter sp. DSM 24535]|uniref:hydantoinase/oxoprolinase family protein n=1 Tax=Roseixanthobacter psychrophilus TaxID=3119917 RepID=UPI003726CFA8